MIPDYGVSAPEIFERSGSTTEAQDDTTRYAGRKIKLRTA